MSWLEALEDDQGILQSEHNPREPMALHGDNVVVFAVNGTHVLLDSATEMVVIGSQNVSTYLADHGIDPDNGWSTGKREYPSL